MQIITVLAVLLVAYLLGSIPFGWVIVKLTTGRDVRQVESGRTGGTNVWRAAGMLAGFFTAALDMLKSAASVWLVRWLIPADTVLFHWIEVAAPLLAILGHNYSIYLIERREDTGKMRLRGGAGGAPSLGGAIGLWAPAGIIVLPLAFLVYFLIGFASVTTMSIAFFAAILFAIKAVLGDLPWQYILYGLVAEIMVVWALRPNLDRLRLGTERIHGLRVWLKNREKKTPH
ncbi:MAG: glycerol-3-phosphate acyltransferase [Anaerolineaceae bacterium]|nr:glycerol-3-phosphate acyltransferase [Anaerolineaceae bacterium]